MSNSDTSDLIFDVGAHKGEDSDFYLKLGFRVVAIEANPTLVCRLKARFSEEIREGRYTVVERAIGDSDGTITFFVNKRVSVWGTAKREFAERNRRLGADSEEIQVQCVRFSELIKQYGCPYYLKVDIEGADMICVEALEDVGCCPRYVSIESSDSSWSDLLKEFEVLERLGYSRFAVVNQKTHKGGVFRSRTGQLISHSFEDGATGPFGENLNGFWLSKKQAILRYVPIFVYIKTIGDNSFHATILRGILRRIPILGRLLLPVGWYDTHAMQK